MASVSGKEDRNPRGETDREASDEAVRKDETFHEEGALREDKIFREALGDDEDCAYLPNEQARLRYRLVVGCSPERYQAMLERGWRRFGRTFFRPECRACCECRSLRVDVATFAPNRSMRRTLKANRDLEAFLGPPTLSAEHLDLYHRYHGDMSERRGWAPSATGLQEYFETFVDGQESFGHELTFRLEGRLVAVALVDLLPRGVSAVYCYYDPTLRSRGLGVFSVLCQVELARRIDVPHLYLGFRISGNRSMRYKARYRPHELLEGRPDDAEPVRWLPPASMEEATEETAEETDR